MLKYIALSLLFVVSTLAGRIVGGHNSDITQHPHQVSLQLKKPGSHYHLHHCGGSIIGIKVIFGAAHCVGIYSARHFRIAAGSSYLYDTNAVRVQVIDIRKHEKFNEKTFENDVALFYLKHDLPINYRTIAPIALATQALESGTLAIITGWGATSTNGPGSYELLQANVPIVSNDRCDAAYTLIYRRSRITSGMICAGYEGVGGTDSCQGDSGGPLSYNGTLYGAVSWGYLCGSRRAPGVYASVPYFYNWIMRYSGL